MARSVGAADEKGSSKNSELFDLIRSNLPEKAIIAKAKELLASGASLKARAANEFGNTPCIEAIIHGKKEVALFLIRHAVNTHNFDSLNMQDTQNNCKNNPLFLCIKRGWIEHALLLIKENDVDVHLLAANNFSALHYACLLRLDDVIVALIGRGANKEAENEYCAKPSDYYLYEFSEIDHLPQYDSRSGASLHFGIPDLKHVKYFEGLPQRNKQVSEVVKDFLFLGNVKSLSDKFKKHIKEYHTSTLTHQIDAMDFPDSQQFSKRFNIFSNSHAFQRKIYKQYDEFLSKKINELQESYPSMNEKTRFEEASRLAKQAFIEEYLQKEGLSADAKHTSPGKK